MASSARTTSGRRHVGGALVAAVALAVALAQPATPAAAATSAFACQPANGLSTQFVNAPDTLLAGRLAIPGFRQAVIGGPNINWAANPYVSSSWRLQFHSLRWLESLTDRYRSSHDVKYLNGALAIAHDWVLDNPRSAPKAPEAWNGMYSGLRASALACLAHETSTDPAWLTATLRDHAAFLSDSRYYAGYWNQGLEQNIGLLAIGCETGTAAYKLTAANRMATSLPFNIDAQGALNEQAPGYGQYLYARWRYAATELSACGRDPGTILARTDALGLFIARSTLPDGTLAQLGDTFAVTESVADQYGDYVRSRGATGTAPPGQVAVYNAGYAFARSGWGTERPYASEVAYTLRFGPAYAYHGHLDHTAYTLFAGGMQWLIDSGHNGYVAGPYRDWLRSPEAHNVAVVAGSGTSIDRAAITPLTSHVAGTTALGSATDSWVVTNRTYRQRSNQQWVYLPRLRRLVVERDTGVTAVVDQVTGSVLGPVAVRQLWHLPTGVVTTVSGRSRVTATAAGKQLVMVQVPLGETLAAGSLAVVKGSTAPIQGWVSTVSGEKVAVPTVEMVRSGRSARILSLLVPVTTGQVVTATAHGLGSTWTVAVNVAGRAYLVTVPPSGPLTLR